MLSTETELCVNCDSHSSGLDLNFLDLLAVDSFLPNHSATLSSVGA